MSESIEVNISRLLLAAVKTAGELKINLSDYTSNEIDDKRIMLSYDDETKEFVLNLADKEVDDSSR
jgi:hypothetical protein